MYLTKMNVVLWINLIETVVKLNALKHNDNVYIPLFRRVIILRMS